MLLFVGKQRRHNKRVRFSIANYMYRVSRGLENMVNAYNANFAKGLAKILSTGENISTTMDAFLGPNVLLFPNYQTFV